MNISTFDGNSSRGNPPVVAPNPDGVGTGALPLQNIDALVEEVRQQS